MLTIILLLYVAGLFALSYFRSGKGGNNDFFTAGRTSKWYLVAFGMVGATISGISVVSVPGMVGAKDMTYLQMVLGFIPGYAVVAFVLLPMYYKKNLTSIYQYLNERFGFFSHKSGSVMFIIYKMMSAAVKLMVVLVVLHKIVLSQYGISFTASAAIVVSVIYLYTFQSGVRTVVVTDCFQTLFLVISVVVITVCVILSIDCGINEIATNVLNNTHTRIFVFEDWSSSSNFFKQFLSGIFIVIVMTGLDQDVMQKNLTCRTLRESQKNMMWCGVSFLPLNFVLLIIGILLLILSNISGLDLPSKSDEIMPMFAERFGGAAMVCLCLGLVSASFSSADSALVGLTTSFFFDVLGKKSDEISVRMRRIVHLCFSTLLFVLILVFSDSNRGSAIDTFYVMVSYAYAPLLGLFLCGMFTKISPRDVLVPFTCILTPVLMYFLSQYSSESFGYNFGYELLAVGGMIEILLLYLCGIENRFNSKNQLTTDKRLHIPIR